MGVEHIKIAGRDGNSQRKRRSLDMVREVAALLATENNNEEIISFAQQIRGEPDLCRDGCMCYYPEIVVEDREVGKIHKYRDARISPWLR